VCPPHKLRPPTELTNKSHLILQPPIWNTPSIDIDLSREDVERTTNQTILYVNVPMQGDDQVRFNKFEALARARLDVDVFLVAELGLPTDMTQSLAARLSLTATYGTPQHEVPRTEFERKTNNTPYAVVMTRKHVPLSDQVGHESGCAASVRIGAHWISVLYSHNEAPKLTKSRIAEFLIDKRGLVIGDCNPSTSAELVAALDSNFSSELVNQRTTFWRGDTRRSLDKAYVSRDFPLTDHAIERWTSSDHAIITVRARLWDLPRIPLSRKMQRQTMKRYSRYAQTWLSMTPLQ